MSPNRDTFDQGSLFGASGEAGAEVAGYRTADGARVTAPSLFQQDVAANAAETLADQAAAERIAEARERMAEHSAAEAAHRVAFVLDWLHDQPAALLPTRPPAPVPCFHCGALVGLRHGRWCSLEVLQVTVFCDRARHGYHQPEQAAAEAAGWALAEIS